MPISVTFKIEPHQTMIHGSVRCAAAIRNDTHETLVAVNSGNVKGRPAIVVNRTDSNASTRFHRQLPGNDVVVMPNLEPGTKDAHDFDLAEIFQFDAPGHFQLQALYCFNGDEGEAPSPAVPLTVLPTTALAADTVPLMGATSNLLFHAWVCRLDPPGESGARSGGSDGGKTAPSFELMLSKIMASRRPTLTSTVRLATVTPEVQPVLSAPPNTVPNDQWIAWIQEGSIRFVHHRVGKVSPVLSGKLPALSSRIISPLLLLDPAAEHPAGAAAAFVLVETGAGADLHELHLHDGGAKATKAPIPLDFRPLWAKAAYLADRSRHIFLLANDEPEEKPHFAVKLRRSPMPARLAHTLEVFSAPAVALAADLLVTRSNAVRGVVLAAASREPNAPLSLYPWIYRADTAESSPLGEWSTGPAHRVPWPHPNPPRRCAVRINEHGRICVLLAADELSPWWYYSTAGAACTIAPPFCGPANIVFRYGDDPSLMISAARTGYRFIKPASRPAPPF